MVDFHPLADAFPLMEGDDFDQLVKDIEDNGQRHPVMRYEGRILDGRNRYRACQRLGIKAHMVEYTGTDPVAYVISENLARRHLTPGQRAIAAEKLATALQGRPRKNGTANGPAGPEAPKHETTITEAAQLMDASPTAVKRVRRVRKDAVPEVVEAMDAGEITPTAAENLATRSPEEQREIISTSESPKELAAKANQTSRAGRGRVSPKTQMARHMDMPDLRVVQDVAADWDENAELIKDLNPERLADFLVQLDKSRAATVALIALIRKNRAKAAPAKRAPAKKTAAAKPATGADGKAPAKRAPAKKAAAPAKAAGSKTATASRKTPTGTTVAAVPDAPQDETT